jgi:hypothetical protein
MSRFQRAPVRSTEMFGFSDGEKQTQTGNERGIGTYCRRSAVRRTLPTQTACSELHYGRADNAHPYHYYALSLRERACSQAAVFQTSRTNASHVWTRIKILTTAFTSVECRLKKSIHNFPSSPNGPRHLVRNMKVTPRGQKPRFYFSSPERG